MSIEIKQLLIKSNVVDDEEDDDDEAEGTSSIALKNEVLNECRRLIIEMLNDKGHR